MMMMMMMMRRITKYLQIMVVIGSVCRDASMVHAKSCPSTTSSTSTRSIHANQGLARDVDNVLHVPERNRLDRHGHRRSTKTMAATTNTISVLKTKAFAVVSSKRNTKKRIENHRPQHEDCFLLIPRGGDGGGGGGGGGLSAEDVITQDGEDCDDDEDTSSEVTTLPGTEADEADDEEQQQQQQETIDAILQEATLLRQAGKELHDRGDWWEAANVFGQAADLLQSPLSSTTTPTASLSSSSLSLSYYNHRTDYCTCRLHEALCRLKLEEYDACVDICTRILADPEQTSGAIRSRAHHRRAKAYLHLGQDDEALQDARAAAFLGDRKAVALYGKLMRGNSNTNNNNHYHGSEGGGGATIDELASPPMLNDLLQGRNPFLANSNDLSQGNSMLLESLLSKSSGIGMPAETPSLLGQGGAGGTLAKSLLSSLTKRLETDSDSICAYLHKTNPTQLLQLGSLAGISLSEQQAQRLVKFCHSVTPKAIRRTVQFGKRGWYGLVVMRKALKVFNKYKHLLILWALAAWIQSAIRRPIPISKKAAKAMAAALAVKK